MGASAALIFGSVEYESWDFLKHLRAAEPAVICADGGLNCARHAGFRPDYYIGDGDSGGSPESGLSAIVLPTRKDLTDLQAAWEQAYAMGFREIYLTGCTGGRQDHHLSALQLLEAMADRGCKGMLLDPVNEISFHMAGEITVQKGRYRYFSLIPVEKRLVVSICGASYPLDHRLVVRGDSLCISNEAQAQSVSVTIHEGACYLVQSERL